MKTCPHCGGEARVTHDPCPEGYTAAGYCETCGLSGPEHTAESLRGAEFGALDLWDGLPRGDAPATHDALHEHIRAQLDRIERRLASVGLASDTADILNLAKAIAVLNAQGADCDELASTYYGMACTLTDRLEGIINGEEETP